jgi:hypothetical protein
MSEVARLRAENARLRAALAQQRGRSEGVCCGQFLGDGRDAARIQGERRVRAAVIFSTAARLRGAG